MKIAIDVSPLESGHKFRGVGFYVKYLKDALLTYFPENSYLFFKNIQEVKSVDIIHYPYFEPFSQNLPFLNRFPTIVTIHDLTPFVLPKEFAVGVKGKLFWNLNKIIIRRVSAIITDSDISKKDIVKLIGISSQKVHVVYLAAGDEFIKHTLSDSRKKELREKYNLPSQFALYVGDVTANKNLPRLLKAVESIDSSLVLVGKALAQKEFDRSHPWNKDLVTVQKLASTNNKIHILGFLPGEDLIDLYNLATVFTMPSLYEGFGLPVLEAMKVGCPVITSREGSLPEVAGEAAVYVDAYKIEDIARGIKQVMGSLSLQNDLREKGRKQASKFSWEESAKQTNNVYKAVLQV